MNLKFLLQPTIEKIREEGREEERQENAQTLESWWEEQVRTGKVTVNEDVELPDFGGNGNAKHSPGDNGKEGA